jgi:hypothetical protein
MVGVLPEVKGLPGVEVTYPRLDTAVLSDEVVSVMVVVAPETVEVNTPPDVVTKYNVEVDNVKTFPGVPLIVILEVVRNVDEFTPCHVPIQFPNVEVTPVFEIT